MPEGEVILTGRGKERLRNDPGILKSLRQYRLAVEMGKTQLAGCGARLHIASGGNADVYALDAGSRIVVKEISTGHSAYFAMVRMEQLKDVVDERIPRWLDMPANYGIVSGPYIERQYMIMQRVPTHVTVETYLSGGYSHRGEIDESYSQFGEITQTGRENVNAQFAKAGLYLGRALGNVGLNPKQYLPDWHEGNVLVEPLQIPIAHESHRLWVIDQ
jgi:hypothetical protein